MKQKEDEDAKKATSKQTLNCNFRWFCFWFFFLLLSLWRVHTRWWGKKTHVVFPLKHIFFIVFRLCVTIEVAVSWVWMACQPVSTPHSVDFARFHLSLLLFVVLVAVVVVVIRIAVNVVAVGVAVDVVVIVVFAHIVASKRKPVAMTSFRLCVPDFLSFMFLLLLLLRLLNVCTVFLCALTWHLLILYQLFLLFEWFSNTKIGSVEIENDVDEKMRR